MVSGNESTRKKREIGYSTRIIGGDVCECVKDRGDNRGIL